VFSHSVLDQASTTAARPVSSAQRFLLPSVRDIIFIFLFWSLLAGPLSHLPLADADIGWHIRTGELILATHSLPRTDPFSSTMLGKPWFAWEWLYDLTLGILDRAGGLNGVVWLCALLVAATFTLLLSQLLRRGTGLLLGIALMLLAEAAAMIHLYARPHIVSWLFSLLWFMALERWERSERGDGAERGKPPRWLAWFFPASMLLWVNLHGGWLFGIALLGIYAFAGFVDSLRGRDALARIRTAQRSRMMALAWVTSVMATFANPFGWHLHAHIYGYLTDSYLMNHIDEFRSPDFHGWAQRSFAMILALVVVAFAGDRLSDGGSQGQGSGNRSGSRLDHRNQLRLSQTLVVLLAVYAGFYSSRNLPVSSMLLVLIAGPVLRDKFAALVENPVAWWWVRRVTGRILDFSERMGALEIQLRRHLWPVVAVIFALAICLHGGRVGQLQLMNAEFDPEKMPVVAVSFLGKEAQRGGLNQEPVFSTDAWGGYLIYVMYPDRKVVVDDRHDLYGSERIRQYLILTQVEPGWQNVLERWQIRTALLPADSTLANLLRELPQDWQVVYKDEVAAVFERR
jgi:hypothetical protein